MQKSFKRNLVIGFGFSLLILLVSSIASYLSIRSLQSSNELVNHTNEVLYNLKEGSVALVDGQTGIRGFLLTNNDDFLAPYRDAEARANTCFDKVQFLTRDNIEQQKNIHELRVMINQHFSYLSSRVVEKRNGVQVSVDTLQNGRRTMSAMRNIIKRMETQELELLKERMVLSDRFSMYVTILIVVAALVAIIISLVFFAKIMNDYSERTRLQAQLQASEEETAHRIEVISHIAKQISKGNYDVRLDDKKGDNLGIVSGSLNTMAASLQESFGILSDNEWLQTGVAQLNNVMIGEKELEVLVQDVIEFIATYTNSQTGAIYLLQGEELYAVAGYTYMPDQRRQTFKLGEGLVGQAVLSNKVIALENLSAEDIHITFTNGTVKPKQVIAIPLYSDEANGALELATTNDYSPKEVQFLTSISNNVSVAITAALNRKRIQELLEETQAQSEELKSQHTELESLNAELEAQAEKLQASEEELKVQQEELQQTNSELEERSVLLEEKNSEIQKKSEDLEISTRYKSEFLANMSHELRTPLNSILLLSRLLSENHDQNMNEEQVEYAQVIQTSGNGLLGLIDEILDLSKIEAGKMDLEYQEVAISQITDGMKALFNEVAKDKKIEFNILIGKDIPLVLKTDKMRLEQILKNLISNALKFTAKGSVTLEVKMHPRNHKTLCFVVRDTGIGIAADKQALVFEAFQQADGSTKRKYGGTGLGLSISRELAKLLGGEISVSSVVDKGSEFTVCLPILGQGHIEAGQIVTLPEPLPMDEPERTTKMVDERFLSKTIPQGIGDDRNNLLPNDKVILIVEDDRVFAKSLLDFTRKNGYKGIVSVRGDQALELALTYRPTGILLDIQLPLKSGWEVMEELKANSQTRHIPVHIMSSMKMKKESLLKGAVDFLDKPLAYEQMSEVFQKIEEIISKKSQKVLIVEDNAKHAKALAYYLESFNINSEIQSGIAESANALQKKEVDCVILDMGIPDMKAYEVLERVRQNPNLENLPIIVFTGKSLSMQEEMRIKKYADSIVVKTAHSYQRMLDEVSLFLHLVEEGAVANSFPKKYTNFGSALTDKLVLIVDDDVRNIYSLTKSLEVLKMNVLSASDGKEALEVLAQHPNVDIVLLDMMMPNMDGYEAAKLIRQQAQFKNLPVIAVTAKAMTGDREKCINAGASDYITKPVDVDQLLSLLRVWLYDK